MTTTDLAPKGEMVLRTLAMPADTNANGDIFGGWCYEGNHLILPGRDWIKREPAGLLECLVLAFDTNSREDGWFWIKFDTGTLFVLSHF